MIVDPSPRLSLTRDGALARLSLDRPEKRNALDWAMLDLFRALLEEAANDPAVRLITVSGQGKCFSAGIDFAAFGQLAPEGPGDPSLVRNLRSRIAKHRAALDFCEQIEVPVIALIHGPCLGLGLELALACDLRFASADAALGLPEAQLGIIADIGGSARMSRLIGPSRTKDLLFTGRSVDAATAERWGLVDRVVERPEALAEAALAYLGQVQGCAPLAVGLAKRVVRMGLQADQETHREIEALAQSLLVSSEDFAEGLAARLEKRPPKFRGR